MKSFIYNAAKATVNNVKEQLTLQKDIVKAIHNVGYFKLLTNRVMSFYGKNIYLDDEMVLAISGIRGTKPNVVITDNGVIVINTAASELPKEMIEALLFHALGHLKHPQKSIPIISQLQNVIGFGKTLELLYKADKYALDKGADILGLLRMLQKETTNNRAIRLRIKRLELLTS